jgi:carbon-monoxide dehydrogenase large subunit
MEKFGKSQPVKRVEDIRFLTGEGRYVDDIAPANAFHALFLRSPVAHATITRLDLDAARETPGVKCVLKAEDCEAMGIDLALGDCQDVTHWGTPQVRRVHQVRRVRRMLVLQWSG